MSAVYDFNGLSAQLLATAESTLKTWFPSGRKRGKEFVIGSLAGDAGDSLSVNIKTGVWMDFATGETGADLIDLYAAHHSITLAEAFKDLGGDTSSRRSPPLRAISPPPKPERTVITPVPDHVEPCNCVHPLYGAPSAVWTYQSSAYELLGYVARYDPDGHRKQIVPWTYDGERWGMGQWQKPRPMYGIQRLADRPDAPVMLVAGEKCADAAHAFAGNVYVVMTWPGGELAWKHTDFGPIHGRQVLIWPDADETGRNCTNELAASLAPHCSVKTLDTAGMPDGWDAADSGFDWPAFKAWATPRASVFVPTSVQEQVEQSDREHQPEYSTGAASSPISADTGTSVSTSVQRIPRHAITEAYGLEASEKGPYTSTANIVRVLMQAPELRQTIWFDEFLERMMTVWNPDGEPLTTPREWSDVDDIRLQVHLQESLGMPKLGKLMVADAVQMVSQRDRRNEAQAYLNGLTWDGTQRLNRFLPDCFGTEDSDYTQQAGRNFWVSLAARIQKPGCKVDTMLVLEGSQGAGKSQALAIVGGQWFAEAHESPAEKDFYLNLAGKILIEIGEMDAFNRSEVTKVKQVISCQTDRYRAPYERRAADHPRRGVFAGTTNRDDWNKDETGARRFWPVYVGQIDHQKISETRDQCFAEAASLLANGATWWEMPVADTLAEQEARREMDAWEDEIEHFLLGRSEVLLADILSDLLQIPIDRQDKQVQSRCAKALRVLGWVRCHYKVSRAGRQVRLWVPKRAKQVQEPAF